MGPCKNCIVRAGCTKDCHKLDVFLKSCSHGISSVSMILSSITCAIIIFLLSFIPFKEGMVDSGRQILSSILWIACIFIATILNIKHEEKFGDVAVVIFAPIIVFAMLYTELMCSYVKSIVRKPRA